MTSHEVRKTFIDFFAARDHRPLPSSPLVLPNDPTLLFANAGMNQFKDVFTGREKRDYVRAVTSQKCLRVSGKHNDLEMVGRTPRHHTFFEMLGNFSFGDYFKELACEFAWELATQVYGLPQDRLWVTVFRGTDAVPADDEALAIWRDRIGVDPGRILRLGEKENFWRMGDTGPCGPCSEIHFDLGDDLTSVAGPSNPETDERRFLEIWNLVFMQFNQRPGDGPDALESLPAPSIDTGMGLERITAVLQDKRTNYDTDLFMPILEAGAKRAGIRYGADAESDFALRVIADHARALVFLVADGIIPSNDRRGYVLRRLLRRAIRYGRKLGIDEPFLHEITPVVIDGMADVYPELLQARAAVLDVGRREEMRFSDTLSTGLELLEKEIATARKKGTTSPQVSGKALFQLHDTFGFPLDLARDIAEERSIALDEAGFEREMQRQRERARASWKQAGRQESPTVFRDLAGKCDVRFVGYGTVEVEGAKVLALLGEGQPTDTLTEGQEGDLVLATTPFYAESGGQVADTGYIASPHGRARVLDVQRPAGSLIVHRVRVEAGRFATGDEVLAEVDAQRRDAIRRNHTATHLLHAALREVVGTHVKQAGSRVDPDRLRFDFSHFAGISDETLVDIETLVNRQILANTPVSVQNISIDEALAQGAMALFGEKYGDEVRMVGIGDFSLELCGGIHTSSTGEIGLLKLTQERGVASGTRRVEAVTGYGSLDRFRQEHAIVRALEEQFSVQRDTVLEEIDRRLELARELQRRIEREKLNALRARLADRAENAQTVGGVKVLIERLDGLEPTEMRELADNLRQKLGSGVVILGRAEADKASLLVAVTDDLKQRVPAGDLVRRLGKIIGGGGGGRPDLAEAGGKNPERLDEALRFAIDAVGEKVGAE